MQSLHSDQAELNAFTAENSVFMANLQQAYESFQLSRELLDLSQSGTSLLESEYRNGRATYLELIYGLRDLLESKTNTLSSYFELETGLYRYKLYEGSLYDYVTQK